MEKDDLEIVNQSMSHMNGLVNDIIFKIGEELDKGSNNEQFLIELVQLVNTLGDYNDFGQQRLYSVRRNGDNDYDFTKRQLDRQTIVQQILDTRLEKSSNSSLFK